MQTSVRKFGVLISTAVILCFAIIGAQAAQPKSHMSATKPSVKITASQAEKIALAKFPGKIVEKTKLENEEGVMQYSVMVKSGNTLREVMVNAKTGKIDSVEVTTSGKEKREGAQEKATEKSKSESTAGAKAK